MRSEALRTRLRVTCTALLLLSLGAAGADRAGLLAPVRPILHDALSPGRITLLAISPGVHRSAADSSEPTGSTDLTQLRESAARDRQLLRQLLIENSQLRHELKQTREQASLQTLLDPARSLMQYELVPARVLSASGLPGAVRELLLDAGRAQGVTRAELVVDGSGPVLDAGTTSGVAIGDRVLSGAIVIGRVERTARWVSAVQPVTADGFRAQATLLRGGPGGRHFGATGILEGMGEAQCRLTGIPHTEAVAVGDDVVTADVSGIRGPRLYFGKVVKADFLAGGQWDIRIQPAADADSLDEVAILRLNVTPSVRTSTATNASATRTAAANDRSTP